MRVAAAGALARAALLRDRVRILVWVAAIGALVLVTAESTKALYATQAALDEAAAAARGNAAALAFNGPDQGLDTLGGQVAFQVGAAGLTVVGLMSLLLVVRLTRGEEEAGRLELVRSLPVGRLAPLVAAVLVVAGIDVAVGAVVAAGLLLMGLPVAGTLVLAASFTCLGLVFCGAGAVLAQVTEGARTASGLALALLGAAYVVRAAGDARHSALSWASPIGLAQKARPYAGDRPAPLVLCLAVAAGLVAAAVLLAARRDLGAGLLAQRPGPSRGGWWSHGCVGLAVRLQFAALAWWCVGLFGLGAAYGSVASSINDFVGDNDAVRRIIDRSGSAGLTDSYLAVSLFFLALPAAGAAVQIALRAAGEEVGARAEALLADPVPRSVWLGSHALVAAVGSVAILAASGGGVGAAYAVTSGDAWQLPRLTAAALAFVPALWLFIGVAVALHGVSVRLAPVAWVVLGAAVAVGLFGVLLDLPRWLLDASPFEHVAQVPAARVDVAPLAVLALSGAALVAGGLAGIRHRDIGQ